MSQNAESVSQSLDNGEETPQNRDLTQNLQQFMTQHFENIYRLLIHLVHGNALIIGNLSILMQDPNILAQDVGRVQELLQYFERPQTSTAAEMEASTSGPSTSSAPAFKRRSRKSGTSEEKTVTCADCGKVCKLKSYTDSITKHAKETSCRPFGCSHCEKRFKKSSVRNLHEKTHSATSNIVSKRKASDSDDDQENEGNEPTKRIKLHDPIPLKDQAFKLNQMK